MVCYCCGAPATNILVRRYGTQGYPLCAADRESYDNGDHDFGTWLSLRRRELASASPQQTVDQAST